MESDERFKHLATDPRFKTLRKPQRKIQIDERFQSMFTDKKFTLKYSKDKRGRKQNKTSGDDLKKYYSLEGEPETTKEEAVGEEEGDDDELEPQQVDDEEVDTESELVSGEEESEDDEESELSSSSDESESGDEDAGDNELDMIEIKYDWQPLDHDAETAEVTTKRLAIQNLDWDRLDVRDIYTLVNSIRPPVNVRIYVSEFGKERLKQEELEGPKELAEMPKVDEEEEEYQKLKDKMRALENPGVKSYKINEYEDADEALDPKNEEIRERIRKYQLSRMKYYYAVAEFDSVESAEAVYKELDGMEYEGSSLELDLRFVPDEIEFDTADIKAECDKSPDLASYKAPQFINSALQQTTVKLTWDETDVKRQERLHRAYTKEELEKDDLEAYLASETESEDLDEEAGQSDSNDAVSVVTANSEARFNKYKMLLQSLDEETAKKKKVDVDVEWGNYDEEEKEVGAGEGEGEGEVSLSSDEDEDDDDDDDDPALERHSKYDGKKQEKKMKKVTKKKKKQQELSEDEELDLLVMDGDRERDEFKFNPDDGRFKAVYESGLYNIDPSHPNFKRTQAFDLIAEKKREKRQKTSF